MERNSFRDFRNQHCSSGRGFKSQQASSRRGQSRSQFQNQGLNRSQNQTQKVRQYNACKRCARFHDEDRCPAWEWECFKCHRYGHTSSVCKNEPSHGNIKKVETNRDTESEDNEVVNEEMEDSQNVCSVIGSINNHFPTSYAGLVENQTVNFEIDTGACVTIICHEEFENLFKHFSLSNVKKNLSSVSGEKLDEKGSVNVKVTVNGKNY